MRSIKGAARAVTLAVAVAGLAVVADPSASSAVAAHSSVRVVKAVGFSGDCLDSNHQGRAYFRSCNGGNYQKWELYRKEVPGPNPVQMRNVATGRCLDADNRGRVYTNPCGRTNEYQWWDDFPAADLKIGKAGAMPNRATGRCLQHLQGFWPFYDASLSTSSDCAKDYYGDYTRRWDSFPA